MPKNWQRLKVWTEGTVGHVVLDRPEVRNALDFETVEELERALRWLEDEARVIVVRGAGGNFCAGADLKYVAANRHDEKVMRGFIEQINRAFFRAENGPVPVIAAVEGYALAGGFEFLQACDIVLVAEDAILGDQHANFGLVPGGGGTQRLPRLIGRQRALGLLLSGERISGREAAAWGLAYRTMPANELEPKALRLAQRTAERSAEGLRRMKQLVRQGLERPLAEGIAMEIEAFHEYIEGEDPGEGLKAFQERRTPRFA
jgi:enoyl-CoA hydratase/carnithine racemase